MSLITLVFYQEFYFVNAPPHVRLNIQFSLKIYNFHLKENILKKLDLISEKAQILLKTLAGLKFFFNFIALEYLIEAILIFT